MLKLTSEVKFIQNMPTLDYNPEKEIPDLSGKSIFITGGR